MSGHGTLQQNRAAVFAFLALLSLTPAISQKEVPVKWIAMSHTAYAITGDIFSTNDQLIIHNHHLHLVLVKKLTGNDLADASNLLSATQNAQTRGDLYRTSLAANARLLGPNTLCGERSTTWVVIVHTIDKRGRINLNLAFFAGEQTPDLMPSIISQSKDLCGTYWYQK